ncbi:MAG: septal ring lytic transglycosylase RlpA family protein [Candidatus Omnitrophota bacterium]
MIPGVKRSLITLMIVSVPLVSAEPISSLQETLSPAPQILVPAEKQPVRPKISSPGRTGVASWYSQSDPFINLRTANGEIFDDKQMTCASWHFPFGTRLKVTNLKNGKSVIVIVNDRGPAKRLNRLIDLTRAAFRKISDTRQGLIRVRVTRLN